MKPQFYTRLHTSSVLINTCDWFTILHTTLLVPARQKKKSDYSEIKEITKQALKSKAMKLMQWSVTFQDIRVSHRRPRARGRCFWFWNHRRERRRRGGGEAAERAEEEAWSASTVSYHLVWN